MGLGFMSIVGRRIARAVSDLAEGAVAATVEADAAPERVFRTLSSKEIIEWWGADGVFRTTDWNGW
jgi:uncharacterized protein YndB with AHSA1/START domain